MSDFDAKLDLKTILQTEGQFVGTTAGVSMRPMIKSGRDVIVVKKKTEPLKKYDVALYTRGDAYVLQLLLRRVYSRGKRYRRVDRIFQGRKAHTRYG